MEAISYEMLCSTAFVISYSVEFFVLVRGSPLCVTVALVRFLK